MSTLGISNTFLSLSEKILRLRISPLEKEIYDTADTEIFQLKSYETESKNICEEEPTRQRTTHKQGRSQQLQNRLWSFFQ
jgi:hypothetical protein